MASPQLVETGGASFEVSLSDGMQALLVENPGELTVVSDPNRKIESSGVTDTSPESDPIHMSDRILDGSMKTTSLNTSTYQKVSRSRQQLTKRINL